MSQGKTGDITKDVMESVSVEQAETIAEVISDDLLVDSEPASDEPVFIVCLTEVPSNPAQEEVSEKSDLLSEPLR